MFFFGLLWTLVTMVIRFPTVINQREGNVPREGGGGGERVRLNNVQFLKVKKTCPYGLNVRIVRGFTCLVSICESFLATGELGILRYNKKFLNSLKSNNRASVLKIWHHIDNMRLFIIFALYRERYGSFGSTWSINGHAVFLSYWIDRIVC